MPNPRLKLFFNSDTQPTKFVIPGAPISKKRASPYRVGDKILMYDGQSKAKRRVSLCLKQQIDANGVYLTHAEFYLVSLWFYYPVPVSLTLTHRNAKLWGLEPCIQKPDLDNMEKFYLDCANEILWPDDCLITAMQSKKLFDKNPRTEMYVMPCKKLNLHSNAEKIITIFDPDRLKEFIEDAIKFKEIDIDVLERLDEISRRDWFMATAGLLVKFFKKYSVEIKKINKHLDYEYNPFDSEILSL